MKAANFIAQQRGRMSDQAIARSLGYPAPGVLAKAFAAAEELYPATEDGIALATASEAVIPLTTLLKGRRMRRHARARWVIMLLMRDRLGMSSVRIGAWFGYDHTTVLHGIKAARELKARDTAFADLVARVDARLW